MIKSKLPNNVLGKIWKLADVDKDGMLDSDEFALAMHLINVKLDGKCQRCNEDLFYAFKTPSPQVKIGFNRPRQHPPL